MRLFIATLSTETNTFAAMPTGIAGFEAYFLRHGTATAEPPNLMTEALHAWRTRAEALGWEVIESLAAIAEPAGRTTAAAHAALRDEILSDLERAGGADIVLLQLHGAMVAEDEDDCEGALVARIRARCPDATIGMALDLHCHLTERMLGACDLITCFREYPHDDATPRAEELFELARRAHAGEIRPVMRAFDCRMVGLYLTKTPVMRGFIAEMEAAEAAPGILSVSLAHGFPWGDVAEVGARMLVIADGDAGLAEAEAGRLGRAFFDLRHETQTPLWTLAEALEEARNSAESPVVLADMGDNSGGGAPGDATFALAAVLEAGLKDVACGIIWDPGALQICLDAGQGARVALRLGGKTGLLSGDPLDLVATVTRVETGLGQHLGPGLEPLGRMAALDLGGGVEVLVNDLRTQVYHPEAFEQMGIPLAGKRLVVVKSLFHFHAPFAAIAPRILQVATPGGTHPDFTQMAYTKRKIPYWPQNEDPFA